MKEITVIIIIALSILLFRCDDENGPSGQTKPLPIPAFEYNVNTPHITFAITSDIEGLSYSWDFGNGEVSSDMSATTYYPFAGEYTVSLTVYNSAGSTTYDSVIYVQNGDPEICSNTIYTLLTGGCDADEVEFEGVTYQGKIWVWDSLGIGARYVGPTEEGSSTYNDPYNVFWWTSTPGFLPNNAYDDEYIFILKEYKYINDCKGIFYYDWAWANHYLGTELEQYKDASFDYIPTQPSKWKIDTTTSPGNILMTLSNNNYIGSCRGENIEYQILTLTEDTLWVRQEYFIPEDADSLTGADRRQWDYLRFLRKGHQR